MYETYKKNYIDILKNSNKNEKKKQLITKNWIQIELKIKSY